VKCIDRTEYSQRLHAISHTLWRQPAQIHFVALLTGILNMLGGARSLMNSSIQRIGHQEKQ
jgi:hypothetical protein